MDHISTNLAIIFDFDGTMVNLFACYNLTRTTKSEAPRNYRILLKNH